MDGELVRFFYYEPGDYVFNTPVEICLYDMDGDLRAMRAGEILWLTDVASSSTSRGALNVYHDWLYDDPDDTGRTDANTICGTSSQVRALRRIGFNQPCPARRLMRIGDVAGSPLSEGPFWWGHGLIRSA